MGKNKRRNGRSGSNVRRTSDRRAGKGVPTSRSKSSIKERFLNLAKLKIKSLSNRPDIAIIHISRLITELDDIINTLSGRLYDWLAVYEAHNLDRKNIVEYVTEHGLDVVGDTSGRQGLEILYNEVQRLMSVRAEYHDMLENTMLKVAPNITALVGADLGAKLIAHVGSLEKLAFLPASTIQVIGAEKALFKHLKNKGIKPPKHGLIFQHPYISGISKHLRGKMARAIANELSLAVKADAFTHRDISDLVVSRLKKSQKRIINSNTKTKIRHEGGNRHK